MKAIQWAALAATAVVFGCVSPSLEETERLEREREKLTISCAGLDYAACSASPYCQPRMEPCALPPCAPNDPSCPVCSPVYACVPKTSHCIALDERSCNKASGCQALYIPTVCPACAPGSTCPPCEGEMFDYCQEDAYCGNPGSTDAGFPVRPDGGSWGGPSDAGHPVYPDAGSGGGSTDAGRPTIH
ncbi:MAG: hypothetical protein ACT4TC_25355 [Myxococcaceae bacterium]